VPSFEIKMVFKVHHTIYCKESKMTKKCGRCLQDLNLEFFNTKNKKNGKEIKQSFCKRTLQKK